MSVGFTGVTTFNQIDLNIAYTQSSGHTIYIQLYNYNTSTYDNIGYYNGLGGYQQFQLGVISSTNYISGGATEVRLYHSNTGNVAHQTNIDYIAIVDSIAGGQGPRGLQGTTGSQGSQGLQGAQGIQGSQGSQGTQGSQGSQGLQGTSGIGKVYSNGVLVLANSNINFNNTDTTIITVSVDGTGTNSNVSILSGAAQYDASPPSSPIPGEFWFDTSTAKIFQYYSNTWVELGTSQVSNLYGRNTLWANTSILAPGANQTSNISAFKSYVLMTVYTSSAAWVRIYTDYASLLSDASRSISTDPTAGSGIVADIATTGAVTQKITPFLFGGNLDSPPTSNMYVSVTNTSGGSAAINTSVTITRLET